MPAFDSSPGRTFYLPSGSDDVVETDRRGKIIDYNPVFNVNNQVGNQSGYSGQHKYRPVENKVINKNR